MYDQACCHQPCFTRQQQQHINDNGYIGMQWVKPYTTAVWVIYRISQQMV